MPGSEPSIDWYDLAPRIEHQMRERIVEALRRVGPLAVSDLKGVLVGDAKCHLAHVPYHLTVLLREEVLTRSAGSPLAPSTKKPISPPERAPRDLKRSARRRVRTAPRSTERNRRYRDGPSFRGYKGAQRLFSEYGEDLLLLGGLGFGDQNDKPG